MSSSILFLHDAPTTEIYTLSLHDALPISPDLHGIGRRRHRRLDEEGHDCAGRGRRGRIEARRDPGGKALRDRKSTRLNSSHGYISYAVFCLKKKRKNLCRARGWTQVASEP